MAKKKIKASELTDADCRFISLVGKGANRIPIRVLKSKEGNTMFKGMEGLFIKEVSQSYVAAFVVDKDADMDLAKATIEKAGFKTTDVEKKDEMTIFHQNSAPKNLEHQYIVKMSEGIAVHVVCTKAFDPFDFETASFKELFAKAGVLPNIFMAHEVLKEVTMNILFSKDVHDSKDASKKIKKALNEFSAIVTSMVENIPVSAFKIEDPTLIAEVKKEMKSTEKKEEDSSEEAEDTKKGEDGTEDSDDNTEDTKKGEDTKEGDDTESEGGEEKSTDEGEETKKSEKTKESKSEDKDDGLAEVLKALKDISGEIVTLKESVSGIDKIQEGLAKLEDRVDEVSKVAKSTDEALNGVTNTDPEGDRSVSTKSEDRPSALKDTAYSKIK